MSRDYKHDWTPVHLDFVVDNLADAVTTAQQWARACLILHPSARARQDRYTGRGLSIVSFDALLQREHPSISVHELLISIFLFLTTPVSTHLMARAGLHLGMRTAGSRSTTDSSHEER